MYTVSILALNILRLPDINIPHLHGNHLMSWMGWSKTLTVLFVLPVLLLSEEATYTIPQGDFLKYEADLRKGLYYKDIPYPYCNPGVMYIPDIKDGDRAFKVDMCNDMCNGLTFSVMNCGYEGTINPATVTVTDTVITKEMVTPRETVTSTQTVTHTATQTNTAEPCPNNTQKEHSMCKPKYAAWVAGYVFGGYMDLFYCDRYNINNRYFEHMACESLAQGSVGFSLGASTSIMSSCGEIVPIKAVQGTSFVGLLTAFYFKTYGCVGMFPDDINGHSKCNEITDHAINVFSSVGSTVII